MNIVDYTPDGEPVYEYLELPEDWDMDDEERLALYREWSDGIGLGNCCL